MTPCQARERVWSNRTTDSSSLMLHRYGRVEGPMESLAPVGELEILWPTQSTNKKQNTKKLVLHLGFEGCFDRRFLCHALACLSVWRVHDDCHTRISGGRPFNHQDRMPGASGRGCNSRHALHEMHKSRRDVQPVISQPPGILPLPFKDLGVRTLHAPSEYVSTQRGKSLAGENWPWQALALGSFAQVHVCRSQTSVSKPPVILPR